MVNLNCLRFRASLNKEYKKGVAVLDRIPAGYRVIDLRLPELDDRCMNALGGLKDAQDHNLSRMRNQGKWLIVEKIAEEAQTAS